jgi:hypothetical protein
MLTIFLLLVVRLTIDINDRNLYYATRALRDGATLSPSHISLSFSAPATAWDCYHAHDPPELKKMTARLGFQQVVFFGCGGGFRRAIFFDIGEVGLLLLLDLFTMEAKKMGRVTSKHKI